MIMQMSESDQARNMTPRGVSHFNDDIKEEILERIENDLAELD